MQEAFLLPLRWLVLSLYFYTSRRVSFNVASQDIWDFCVLEAGSCLNKRVSNEGATAVVVVFESSVVWFFDQARKVPGRL